MEVVARLVGADKTYGACRSLGGVSVAFRAGELHAVAGENGAGKSTLVKLLAGHLAPTEGHVELAGRPLAPATPREGLARGLGLVEQHGLLVPSLRADENLALGHETTRGGRLDLAATRARAEVWAARLGVAVRWDAPVSELGIVARQWLEILRALARDARVLLLDEPTALLGPVESARLYAGLRALVDEGRAVVVVTHHLDEIRAYADRVTVLRRGEVVLEAALGEGDAARQATTQRVRGAILGELADAPEPAAPERGAGARAASAAEERAVLRLEGVSLRGRLRDVSLALAAGEIVGLAGVEGSGQRELVELVVGLAEPETGRLWRAPWRTGARAAAFVPEDRHLEGMVEDASLEENVLLGDLASVARGGVIDRAAARAEATRRLDVTLPGADLARPLRELSGGNQQKVVVARALAQLAGGAPVLVAAQPTRGLDVGASRAVRGHLAAAAAAGAAVLLVSHDLDELRALCHRIVVLYRGAVQAELPAGASLEALGHAMLGEGNA